MKKKNLALLLLLALLWGLAGCGESPLGSIAVMDDASTSLRQQLWIVPGDLTGLDEMLETADGSGTATGNKLDIVDSQGQGGTDVRLLETLGMASAYLSFTASPSRTAWGTIPPTRRWRTCFSWMPISGPHPGKSWKRNPFAMHPRNAVCITD